MRKHNPVSDYESKQLQLKGMNYNKKSQNVNQLPEILNTRNKRVAIKIVAFNRKEPVRRTPSKNQQVKLPPILTQIQPKVVNHDDDEGEESEQIVNYRLLKKEISERSNLTHENKQALLMKPKLAAIAKPKRHVSEPRRVVYTSIGKAIKPNEKEKEGKRIEVDDIVNDDDDDDTFEESKELFNVETLSKADGSYKYVASSTSHLIRSDSPKLELNKNITPIRVNSNESNYRFYERTSIRV